MYTLGISCYYHDSAAALLKDGNVLCAVEEERFSRKKFDDGFPKNAIEWCLNESGIKREELDQVAFYDKPILKFERLLDNYLGVAPRGLFSFVDIIPKWIHKRLWVKEEIRKDMISMYQNMQNPSANNETIYFLRSPENNYYGKLQLKIKVPLEQLKEITNIRVKHPDKSVWAGHKKAHDTVVSKRKAQNDALFERAGVDKNGFCVKDHQHKGWCRLPGRNN